MPIKSRTIDARPKRVEGSSPCSVQRSERTRSRSARGRAGVSFAALALVASALVGCGSSSSSSHATGGNSSNAAANSAGSGITTQSTLSPFAPSNQSGAKPNLPKVVAYVQDDSNETEQAIASGLEAGAKDTGLKFVRAQGSTDPQKDVQAMQQELVTGVGALVVGPVDPASQAPVIRQGINQGVDVDTLVFGPGTDQVNAAQYAVGKALADVAANYIKTKLGGKANVVLLDQANVPAIAPRFKAIHDVLRTIPDAKIVADITPSAQDPESGFKTMSTILQTTPNVDVVLGSDEVVQGALAALQAAHKTTNSQFLGGLDGEPTTLATILKGGPYKATVALSPAIFGYAWAQYAADWFAGKSIPQAINVTPVALTNAAQIDAYKRDESDPAAVWKDKRRLATYIQMYGKISYATRRNYLAYTWPGIVPSGR